MTTLPLMRYGLHRVAARPYHICWVIGTLAIWIPVTLGLHEVGALEAAMHDWSLIARLLAGYAATAGLGFYAGLFGATWIVLPLCRRVNGAPLKVGDSVAVLSGRFSGYVATIYEIARGQGGQPLPRIEMGEQAKAKYQDIFEEYSLLRISPR